jgi:RNA polymerase sigma factor (sigma-70 family)
MTPDSELLARFARTNAEDAFAELVKRHVNLVYSAALRQVAGDAHLAQDVAQTVFTDLARKAGSLARRESLTGWLYTSAHFAAAKIIRTETRRRDREETFMREAEDSGTGVSPVQSASEADWETLRPALDAVMHELKEADREAVLLRYFENRPFAEVGAQLGLNENAARMRVERALEKLRTAFARRGGAATAALASVLSANAVTLAPAGLAATLTTASLVSAGTGTFTLLKIMTMTKLKLGLSALVVAGAATVLVMQQQAQGKLRADNESLTQQLAQLQTDYQNLSTRLTSVGGSKKLPIDSNNELLKLRGEVGVLQRQANEANQKVQTAAQKLSAVLSAQAKFTANESSTINAVKYLGLDMRIYAGDHGNQYPTNDNLYQLAKDYDSNTNLLQDIPAIEYINIGAKLNPQNQQPDYPNMVVIRERIARQAPDGTWRRVYLFADGSVQTATSYDGNFDAWEKANTYSPPPDQ